ncbi:MAG: phenylalanine--tRNA ligase subunit beta [Bacteroidia bacterium]|nr:phenylalanine--tRNA ligase subunit beta [Bacteroidia bacterium]
MKISYNWLKEYIDIDQSPEEIKVILTMLGLEIGKVEEVGGVKGNLEGVLVGHVLTAVQHPNADKLRVTTVDVGGEEPLQIVCGAPNVAAGQKVPVATVGTVLYPFGSEEEKGLKIKKGKIRGEVSMGMICAEDELGLGQSHDGIMVLEEGLTPGTPFNTVADMDKDYVLEIELTPNRVDGASHYGAARDLAAYKRDISELKLPNISLDPTKLKKKNPIPVEIKATDKCKRYTSIYIEGVEVKESPEWLQKRLRTIGLKPINNVVDITNFVLHELGNPLHAFDADKIEGGKIIVDTLSEKTSFETLVDGEKELLPDSDLLINDTKKPLCIAGTMGGLNSGVSHETKNVFLECAYFDPGTVRRTAKRLGINSDSSFRFERGVDPHMTPTSALRAASLIVEIAGGTASAMEDIVLDDFAPFEVDLSLKKTFRLIGKDISKETVLEILAALEIGVEEDGDILHLTVPQYRVDVQRDVDVIEDILRVYGYNNVEIPSKINGSLNFRPYKDMHRLRETYANYLAGSGFHEILTNSLVAGEFGDDKAVPILNPLSEELNILRQSMVQGALESIRYNQNRQSPDLAFFEFGKTYKQTGQGTHEQEWLALTVTGARHPMHFEEKAPKVSLQTLTKEVERLQKWFGIEGKIRETDHSEFAYGLEMLVDGKLILKYGLIKAELAERFEMRNEVFHMLIDWGKLSDIYFGLKTEFREISQYPSIRRDLSLMIDKYTSFAEIRDLVFKANPKLIKKVELHDVYMGKGIPEDKKSYLISFELQDEKKTLADSAAEKITQRAVQLLEKEIKAEIRK